MNILREKDFFIKILSPTQWIVSILIFNFSHNLKNRRLTWEIFPLLFCRAARQLYNRSIIILLEKCFSPRKIVKHYTL